MVLSASVPETILNRWADCATRSVVKSMQEEFVSRSSSADIARAVLARENLILPMPRRTFHEPWVQGAQPGGFPIPSILKMVVCHEFACPPSMGMAGYTPDRSTPSCDDTWSATTTKRLGLRQPAPGKRW